MNPTTSTKPVSYMARPRTARPDGAIGGKAPAGDRYTGTVKYWSRVKGYGFLTCPDVAEDIFVHYSGLIGHGRKNLIEGEQVTFTLERNPRKAGGLLATGIILGSDGDRW